VASVSQPDEPQGSSDWGGILLGLMVSSLAAFQMLKLPPALPLLIDAYGYDKVTAGGLVSVYALTGLAFSVFAGSAAGKRPMLVMTGALACFVLGNLVTLALPQIAWLNLVARGVEGLGYAIFALAGPAIANRSAAEKDLSIVAGIVAIWVPVGQIVALTIGFLAFDAIGWRALWWASLVLTAGAGFWIWVRRSTVIAVLGGLSRQAGGIVLTARETNILWVTGGVFALWGGQYSAFMTWLPEYMVDTFGIGADDAAAANALSVVAVLCSGLITGGLLRRGVPLGLLFTGTTLIQTGVWFIAPHLGAWGGLAAITLYGIVSGAPPACMFAAPGRLVGGNRAGPTAFAPLMTGRNLGILAAPVVAGWLIVDNNWLNVSWTFGVVTAVSALSGFFMAAAIARKQETT